MLKKHARVKKVLSVLAILVMLFTGIGSLAASAATVYNGGTSGNDDVEGPNMDVTAPGGLDIVSYHIQQPGGTTPSTIKPGLAIGLTLNIYDSREEIKDYLNYRNHQNVNLITPNARLNTSSFRPQNSNYVHPSVVEYQKMGNKEGVKYSLYLELIYTGEGNTFLADVFYWDNTGPANIATYPLSLTLNQCEPTEAPSEGVDVKGTGFVLRSASYGEGAVNAGVPFTLSAEIMSTSGRANIENVTVGVTPPQEISLADGSSLVYIGTVKPNQTIPVQFQLQPGANVEDGSYTIAIEIKGVNAADGSEATSTMNFTVPVTQPERFEIFDATMPTNIMLGLDDGSGYSSLTLVNQGKGAVSNVSVEIKGDGLTTEEGKLYLGHVAGGEQKSADFNLMGETPGQIEAQAVVTYENARGEQKTLTYDFTVSVEDMGGGGVGMIEEPFPSEPMEEESGGFPVWGWVLIALGVIAVVAVGAVILVKQRRKKQAALALAELEEDDLEEDNDENI